MRVCLWGATDAHGRLINLAIADGARSDAPHVYLDMSFTTDACERLVSLAIADRDSMTCPIFAGGQVKETVSGK